MKGCSIPTIYWASLPIWNEETGACSDIDISILLPHETIWSLLNSATLLVCTKTTYLASVLSKVWKSLSLDAYAHVALGFHGDGVVMKKSGDTFVIFSMSFPAIPCGERLICCCLEKRYFSVSASVVSAALWIPSCICGIGQ